MLPKIILMLFYIVVTILPTIINQNYNYIVSILMNEFIEMIKIYCWCHFI